MKQVSVTHRTSKPFEYLFWIQYNKPEVNIRPKETKERRKDSGRKYFQTILLKYIDDYKKNTLPVTLEAIL